MKLYAAGLIANRWTEGHMQTSVQAATIRARDDGAAYLKAINYAKETMFPIAEGWYSHQVTLARVPPEWYSLNIADAEIQMLIEDAEDFLDSLGGG